MLCTFTCLALSSVSVNDNWMSVALNSKEILDDISESEKEVGEGDQMKHEGNFNT